MNVVASTHPHDRALIAGALASLVLGVAALRDGDIVLYNATPSMPVGLYLRTSEPIAAGAIVTVRAIDVAPGYAAERKFTGEGDRFLKRVVGTEGDVICASASKVSINGSRVLNRQSHDRLGRRLRAWSGCLTLSNDQVLLLGETPDSFDGRYWGPTPINRIEGVWRKL